MSSLLEHRPTRYRCTAVEDTLLLVLEPAGCSTSCPASTRASRPSTPPATTPGCPGRSEPAAATSGSTALGTRVGDLVTREPVTTTPARSVPRPRPPWRRPASPASWWSSARRSLGIVTDRDLRNRVLAAGLPPSSPVGSVMTPAPVTLPAGALAFEALLEMVGRDIHHLPGRRRDGRPVGLVTTTDLVRLENSNPVYLAADIGGQTTMAGGGRAGPRIPAVLAMLVDRDVTAGEICRVVTALGDGVRRRVLTLVEAELGLPRRLQLGRARLRRP